MAQRILGRAGWLGMVVLVGVVWFSAAGAGGISEVGADMVVVGDPVEAAEEGGYMVFPVIAGANTGGVRFGFGPPRIALLLLNATLCLRVRRVL